jgi:transposase
LADLLRHGLLRASFIPPAPVRTIRELTRYRKTLVQQRVDEANRLQKTLEGANIKLAAVASDVLGVSGRAMLAAVLDGERDPGVLAELARGVLRAKLPQLRQALNGRVQPHHLVLISQLLAHIDFLEQAIAQVQAGRDRRRHESVPDGRASGLTSASEAALRRSLASSTEGGLHRQVSQTPTLSVVG